MIKNLSFNNSRGEKIEGILKEKGPSESLMLVGHGLNSSQDHPATISITDKLYDMGHSTFFFNFSNNARGFNLNEQVIDIKDITNYFRNYKEIIVLAPSFGALNSAISALKIPKIKGLITVNGFFGSEQLGKKLLKKYLFFRLMVFLKKEYRNNWKYFKDNYKPEDLICNTLIIHCVNDEEVSYVQSKEFFKKAGGKKELYLVGKGDHHLTKDAYRQEIAEKINQWIKANKNTL